VTVFWPDLSHHDRDRLGHKIDVPGLRAAGASGLTCKLSEGTAVDSRFVETFSQVRSVDFAFAGPYHVLWPGQPGQARWLFDKMHDLCPWLFDPPKGLVPIMMCDSEIFQEFTPFRAPTLAEQHEFLDEFKALSGWHTNQLWDYAPEWLYGSTIISKIRYPWVSSKYGGNPAGNYKTIYPGDGSARWNLAA
jgi:hypothetical protein